MHVSTAHPQLAHPHKQTGGVQLLWPHLDAFPRGTVVKPSAIETEMGVVIFS